MPSGLPKRPGGFHCLAHCTIYDEAIAVNLSRSSDVKLPMKRADLYRNSFGATQT